MTRRSDLKGGSWFGIGIEHPKHASNVGTLFRSAVAFDAGFLFTLGTRYRPEASDTVHSWRHLPYVPYPNLDAFTGARPFDTPVVGVEFSEDAKPLARFLHPRRALYLLGAEDRGLSKGALDLCQDVVCIPTRYCLNVSAAGTVLMYDRSAKT